MHSRAPTVKNHMHSKVSACIVCEFRTLLISGGPIVRLAYIRVGLIISGGLIYGGPIVRLVSRNMGLYMGGLITVGGGEGALTYDFTVV